METEWIVASLLTGSPGWISCEAALLDLSQKIEENRRNAAKPIEDQIAVLVARLRKLGVKNP